MTDSGETLLDFENELDAAAPRYFKVLIGIQLAFIIYLVFDLWYDLHKQSDLTAGPFILFLMFIAVPAAGTALIVYKKKAGWIVSVFYFELMAVITGSYLLQQIIKKRILISNVSNLRTLTLFALAAITLTFLVVRVNRNYLHIKTKMLTVTLTITTLIVLALVTLVIKP